MRYKRYTGNILEFNQAIKNFKPIPGVERAYINKSATEFITLDKIIMRPHEINLFYDWTVHNIDPHSGKNNSMKMIRIHGKQYGLSYIMAKTFVENPHALKRVIHKDGNHNNYHAENLEWR